MKNAVLFFIAVLGASMQLIAQSDNALLIPQEKTLNSTQFNYIYRRIFTDVVNNNDKTTIGNFASTDVKEGKVTLNTTFNLKSGNFLTINTTGGINEGLVQIFKNTKFSSNIGVDFKYTNLLSYGSGLSYWQEDIAPLLTKESLLRKKEASESYILASVISSSSDSLMNEIAKIEIRDSGQLNQIRVISAKLQLIYVEEDNAQLLNQRTLYFEMKDVKKNNVLNPY